MYSAGELMLGTQSSYWNLLTLIISSKINFKFSLF